MAVNLAQPGELYPISGIRLASASAGIRYQGRDDLVLVELDETSSVAAVFTKNKFCAAPVILARKNLRETSPRYLLINAGNANAGTGQPGMEAAFKTTQRVSELMGVSPNQVLPFSTGVIGMVIDVTKISQALPCLKSALSEQGWLDAARAIMTTDTVPKAASEKLVIHGRTVHVTGISKGSGMIQPNMATMLAYVGTDLTIDQHTLHSMLIDTTEQTFNAITVDSDTSTNDACVLIATGSSTIDYNDLNADERSRYLEALKTVMQKLAHAIVRDGEGATKFVEVSIESALNSRQAKAIAFSVANSPLVKTALSASDPNWGRIMAAAGKCEDENLDLSRASLLINNVHVMTAGEIDHDYTEQAGKMAVAGDEIKIVIQINRGQACHTVWTTDLTHDYITINADYRS